MWNFSRKILFLGVLVILVLAGCGPAGSAPAISPIPATIQPTATFPPLDPTYAARLEELRHPDVPDLPFADNPDPSLCGIPTTWGLSDPAWLTGIYQAELIQPEVLLYDSHLRLEVVGSATHGADVQILLYQENPQLDYYYVKVAATGVEGWLPEPFLSFDPPP